VERKAFYLLFEEPTQLDSERKIFPGLLSAVELPLPIPNKAVKGGSGDDSSPATDCENTSRPGIFMAKTNPFPLNEGFIVRKRKI